MNNTPLYAYNTFCWSIHPLTAIWVARTFGYCRECGYTTIPLSSYFQIFFVINLEEKFLDHIAILFWILWGSTIWVSIVAIPFYNSTSNAKKLQFLHILINTFLLLDTNHNSECEVASNCFNLYFPTDFSNIE